ncbi:MAG: membrane protein insertase YidC [Sphingomicrobium sp.]
MNENRNMLLALMLSALVLIGWSFLSDRFLPTAGPQTQQVDRGKVTAAPVPTRPTPQVLRDVGSVLAEGQRVKIETPSLIGSINLQGARFDDLKLAKERTTIAKDSPPVRLFSPAGAKDSYFAQYGWTSEGVETPGPDSLWIASSPTLKPGQPVTLTWRNGTGQTFEQVVSVDENYLFTVTQRVINGGASPVGLRTYGLVSRSTKSSDPSAWTNHVGPVANLAGKTDYEVDWETLDEDKSGVTRDSRGGWLGFTDKYWLTALAPAKGATIEASLRKSATGAYQADYASPGFIVAPGTAASGDTRLFAGAKSKSLLDRYEEDGITAFSSAIDWGWFGIIMRPIADLLAWLFHITGNFGVAIICLTLIVRTLMYPIADKQFRSFAGMRKIQPKMKEVQERFKDDKQRQQQEILKLYQSEKVNPAAGCLPILLQIPIFYALYKVLMVSVEMRHQPFVLWIKDLSAPDPMTPVNLFGFLDFTPPSFLAIGILPILLGITMWLQFKLNPSPPDPIQQQVFSIMPWILMFIMAPFAAGLQLYWVVSNILSIGQQKYLYYRYDHERDPPTTIEVKAK